MQKRTLVHVTVFLQSSQLQQPAQMTIAIEASSV